VKARNKNLSNDLLCPVADVQQIIGHRLFFGEVSLMMRMILIVCLAVWGIGLAGTSGASAVPVNGTVIGDLATEGVTPVRWWGHRGYYHRRWGYGYGRHWRRW
jgi:hypothetical protein